MPKVTYKATAEREGDWYVVRVGGLPEGMVGVTQGRTREEAEFMARDVTALLLEVEPDSFDVEMTWL